MKTEISIFKKVASLVPSEIYVEGGIQPILDAIEKEISAEVPDTSTDKGRKAIASNAAKVSKSKVLLDKMGKELSDKLNLLKAPILGERKLARDALDLLRDKIREPLTKYEAEVQRKAVEKFQKAEAEKLAIQVDSDHEFGIMLNEKYDRDLADLKAKEEQERIELEAKELKEKEEYEANLKKQAADAELEKAAQAIKDAEERVLKAERDAIAAEEKAEQDKIAAIKAEQDKQIAKEQHEAAEAEARESDTKNRKAKNNEALSDYVAGGMPEEWAKLAVQLNAAKKIANVTINY